MPKLSHPSIDCIFLGKRFLDLGCGTGFAVRSAAAQARHEGLFCGVDISRRMIEDVRFYSSKEYARMFAEGDLKLVMSRTLLPPMKVHVAEKTGAK